MKSHFILALAFLSLSLSAQVINFPDVNFKTALLNHNPVIDTNSNGEIEVSEAQSVMGLLISSSNISSLSGLENFSNLTNINCSNNQITEFPDYSLTNLITLNCGHNNITSIHVESSPMLYLLLFGFNQIAALDLHNNHDLTYLGCNNNLLSEINICGTAVESVEASDNPNLVNAYVKNGVVSMVLTAVDPPFGQLNFYNCPLLASICYDEEEYDAVQYSLSPGIAPVLTTDCSSDCLPLQVDAFESSNFSLSPNPAESILTVEMNGNTEIQNIRIYSVLGQPVQNISFQKANASSIDISQLKTGTYFIEVTSNGRKTVKKFIKL